jgi:hypothetical protein
VVALAGAGAGAGAGAAAATLLPPNNPLVRDVARPLLNTLLPREVLLPLLAGAPAVEGRAGAADVPAGEPAPAPPKTPLVRAVLLPLGAAVEGRAAAGAAPGPDVAVLALAGTGAALERKVLPVREDMLPPGLGSLGRRAGGVSAGGASAGPRFSALHAAGRGAAGAPFAGSRGGEAGRQAGGPHLMLGSVAERCSGGGASATPLRLLRRSRSPAAALSAALPAEPSPDLGVPASCCASDLGGTGRRLDLGVPADEVA